MGLTNEIVCTQLENSMPSISDNNTVIAYEPIGLLNRKNSNYQRNSVVHKERDLSF